MRLSEAIRLGSLIRPQAYYAWFDDDGSSCAIGAALEACGVPFKPVNNEQAGVILKEFQRSEYYQEFKQGLASSPTNCPVCGEAVLNGEWQKHVKPNITSVIVHLNNDHRWTREQIAAWVETHEKPVERPAQERLELVLA